MFWDFKKSNIIIIKKIPLYKIGLNIFVYRNKKDKEISSKFGLNKNKDILFYNNLATFISNYIFVDNNDLNFDVKYKSILIISNYN